MLVKRFYYYLFYKLYKFWDWISFPKFWSDWKAGLSIDVLWIFVGLSVVCYYVTINKQIIDFGSGRYVVLTYVILVALPNYFIFHHHEQWKEFIQEFDGLPKKTNMIGGVLVSFIVLLIVANLIFAFYKLGQVDWGLYR